MLFNLLSSLLGAAILSNVILQGVGLEAIKDREIRVKPVLVKSSLISLLALVVFLVDYVVLEFVLVPMDMAFLNIIVLALLMIGVNELYKLVTDKTKFALPKEELFGLHSIVIIVGFMGLSNVAFDEAFIQVIGSLIGFIGLSILLTMIQSRMRVNPLIKSFKGLPILLIILGLIALVFSGLAGLF